MNLCSSLNLVFFFVLDFFLSSPGGHFETLKPEDVNPHVTFHHGIPSATTTLAYVPVQKILALSTRHRQVKLLGKDNTQALLESDDEQPSKFLQFVPNPVYFSMSRSKIELRFGTSKERSCVTFINPMKRSHLLLYCDSSYLLENLLVL
ncbi:uncharacterized protein LOC141633332 isoform X1 [Silene latifolia]|uniref:uncharacterized protein LOC141633332 isoform X1 n=1 Tax=Silene latifolia TaxID=37657 RepID=UPI003D76BF30